MTKVLHPAAEMITPFQQGGLDGLCGLYALINAARIVSAPTCPIPTRDSKRMFALGMARLSAKAKTRDAPIKGMTTARQMRLAQTIFALAPGVTLGQAEPRIKRMDRLDTLIKDRVAGGSALLVCFDGRLAHHSVIVGYSARRLLLFDSIGLRYVLKSGLKLGTTGSGGLTVTSLVAVLPPEQPGDED